MELRDSCTSCQNLSSVVQKLHNKFAIYKKKNNQNDEFINIFRKQNILMQALKDELQEKNTALSDSLRKLKCSEVECLALRQILEKEKEDGERRIELEVQHLRNELEKTKTALDAERITNFQLSKKLDEETSQKEELHESFGVERKQLQEKVTDAERLSADFNRKMKHWSSLKDKHDELLRSVLLAIRKRDKLTEAATLEANLLNSSFDNDNSTLDDSRRGSDISPFNTPQKTKSKGILSLTDSSDDDFEEVLENKTASPVKNLTKNFLCSNSSSGIDTDLSKEKISGPSRRSPKKSPRNISPRKAHLKGSPKKGSTTKSNTGKKNETADRLMISDGKKMPAIRRLELISTGCDPMENGSDAEERAENRCLASYREEYTSRCGNLSPLPDTCLPDHGSTITPVGFGSSQKSNSSDSSVFCRVCDSLVSKCTPCQSVLGELSALKVSFGTSDGQRSGRWSPAKETGESMFSLPSSQKQDSNRVSNPPSVGDESLLAFGNSISPPSRESVCVQTTLTSFRRTDVGTETKRVFTKSIGLQCNLLPAINDVSQKPSRHAPQSESTSSQKEQQHAQEEIKCTLCDNKGGSSVCPMKEFLKTSLLSVVDQSKFVSSMAMMDFLETSLLNLIKQSEFISNCSGVYGGYSSLRPMAVQSFYVPQPGMYPANGPASMYSMFNNCFYSSDDPTRRMRNPNCSSFPMFKKEEMSRPNSDGSDGEKEVRSSRSRSSVRSNLLKSAVFNRGLATRSNSKEGGDSSVEEIEVRDGGTKRRVKHRNGSLRGLSNPRKKVREFKRDAKSRSQVSKSPENNSESPVKKRYSRIRRLSDSSVDEGQDIPSDPKVLQEDQIPKACDLPAQEALTQEGTPSTVPAVLSPSLTPVEEDNRVLPLQETLTVPAVLPPPLPSVEENRRVFPLQESLSSVSAVLPPPLPCVEENRILPMQETPSSVPAVLPPPLPLVQENRKVLPLKEGSAGKETQLAVLTVLPRLPLVEENAELIVSQASREKTQSSVSAVSHPLLPPMEEDRIIASSQDVPPRAETQRLPPVAHQTSAASAILPSRPIPGKKGGQGRRNAVPNILRNGKKDKASFIKNLLAAKTAIPFVNGGTVTLSGSSNTSSNIVVCNLSAEARKENGKVAHIASLRNNSRPAELDAFSQGYKRYEVRSTGECASTSVDVGKPKRKSTLEANQGASTNLPERTQETVQSVNSIVPLGDDKTTGEGQERSENESCPDPETSKDSPKTSSPGKSSCLDVKTIADVLEDDLCLSEDSEDDVGTICEDEEESKEGGKVSGSICEEQEEVVPQAACIKEKNQEIGSRGDSSVTEIQTKEFGSKVREEEEGAKAFMNTLEQQETDKIEVVSVFFNVTPAKESSEKQSDSKICEQEVDFVGKSEKDLLLSVQNQEGTFAAEENEEKSEDAEGTEMDIGGKEDKNIQEETAVCNDQESSSSIVLSDVTAEDSSLYRRTEEAKINASLQETVSEDLSGCEEDNMSEVCPTNVEVCKGQDNPGDSSRDTEVIEEETGNVNTPVNEEIAKEDKSAVMSEEETKSSLHQKRKVLFTELDDMEEKKRKHERETALPVKTGCAVGVADLSEDEEVYMDTGRSLETSTVLPLGELEEHTHTLLKDTSVAVCSQKTLNHLDAADISTIVEVFPVEGISANDLDLSAKVKSLTSFGFSDSEDDQEISETSNANSRVSGLQPLANDVEHDIVFEAESEQIEIKDVLNSSESSRVGLYGDLVDIAEDGGVGEETVLDKDTTLEELDCDTSELSRSVFGTLFEDLPETDPNLSGIGGIVAAVLPDLSLCVAEADSSQMEDGNEEELELPSEEEAKDIKQDATEPSNKEDPQTVSETDEAKPAVPKRHLPVVAAPSGPYLTRRTRRPLSNQNSLSVAATGKTKTTSLETSDDAISSGHRLRSRSAAKSPVPSKKKKVVSREFVESDSSESDVERLVISEEIPSGRTSQDGSSGRSTPLNGSESGNSSYNGSEEEKKTRRPDLKRVQAAEKKSRYNTRRSASSRTSDSDSDHVIDESRDPIINEVDEKQLTGPDLSDEASTGSSSRSTRKYGHIGRNLTLEPQRRSLRNLCKVQPPSPNSVSSEVDDVEMEVGKSVKTNVPACPKRASKLQTLRKNLSKVHPLMQKVPGKIEPPLKVKQEKAVELKRESSEPPLKKAKSEKAVETKREPTQSAPTSMQMAKSGRTVRVIAEKTVNLRRGRQTKNLTRITQEATPTTVFAKPRITPQGRLAALKVIEESPESTSNEPSKVPEPLNNISIPSPSTIPKPLNNLPKPVNITSTFRKPKITPDEKMAALQLAAVTKPTNLERSNPPSPEAEPTIKTEKSPPRIIVNNTSKIETCRVYKRSNTLRNLAKPAVDPFVVKLTQNASSPAENSVSSFGMKTELSQHSDVSRNVLKSNGTDVMQPAVPAEKLTENLLLVNAPPVVRTSNNAVSDPDEPAAVREKLDTEKSSSTSCVYPLRPKRSGIWVEPAITMETSCKTPRQEGAPQFKSILLAPPSPVHDMQAIVTGRDLVALIDSTPHEDAYCTDLLDNDVHPLLETWKQRGDKITFLCNQEADVAEGMGYSVPAIRKLLNAYFSSPYFTDELLSITVNSLLNPKLLWVDGIVSRLIVNMVDIDYDSQPCIDCPGPGQFMTKIQQQIIALIMKLFIKYRSIVKDVLALIEHRMFSLGQTIEQGQLSWLTVLHTGLCRIMKWRHVSLIFCYDAAYCFVTRFAAVWCSVFQVWPELLPSSIDCNTTSIMYQVLFHFAMTQGEPDQQSDLKVLRAMLVKRRVYSGRTNSSELVQNIVRLMKEDKCGLISPAMILLSKREGVAWSQDHIINQELLPMLRDWLLNHHASGYPSLPPAAVLTLCGIVRAFRGTESSVSTTHTLMQTLLLDTKAVAEIPDLEHSVCAGLTFLSRHNIEFAITVLKKWQPQNKYPQWLVNILLGIMTNTARPSSWWKTTIKQLLDHPVFPLTA